MALTRRQFLTLMGGSAGAAVLFQACGLPEKELLIDSPPAMPEDLVSGIDNWYATTNQQGGSSEGIVVRVMEGRAKKVEGNPDHPLNLGGHSALSEAALQGLYHPDRISAPQVRTGARGSGEYREISWEDAIARLSSSLGELDSSNENNKAVFVSNPTGGHVGLVLEKFTDSLGTRHLSYEALETNVLRTALKAVFGTDSIPEFDIDNADLVLSFGADFLSSWVSPTRYARGYGEFRQGHEHRGKLIHVDSRFSMTAANADQWVHVNPGTEGLLAMSIMQVLSSSHPNAVFGDLDVDGVLDSYSPANVANEIGVSVDTINQIAEDFSHSEHPIALGGGSAGAHTNGTQNLKAIYSLNHVASNLGKKGGVLLNPNSPFDGVGAAPPSNSFSEFHRLAEEMKAGNVKVLMVKDADFYYGMTDTVDMKAALDSVPLVVSFGGMMDDTTSIADLILPQHHFFEDWGTDVPLAGPGYQMIGFQQPVVRPFFEHRGSNLGTKGFADILMATAQVMGKDLGLDGETFKEVIRNDAKRLYELDRGQIVSNSFEGFWNGVLQRGGWWDTSYKVDEVPRVENLAGVASPEFGGLDQEFYIQPFISTLGDGSAASLPWLQAMPDAISTATWQTWVEINHKVAEEKGISEGDVLEIRPSNGRVVKALAMPNPAVPPDTIGIPIGQGHRDGGRYSSGRGANILSILDPKLDSENGSLAWAATRANVTTTGEWIRVPKFENTVPEFPRDEHHHIIQITSGDNH
ncbi:MAG: molybdopterin-dependent oxidoreductase [SAR202 cluster bacterium]|nr:molybdopterin-dependent oxidoreductase [SAR202 cluster bacterium]